MIFGLVFFVDTSKPPSAGGRIFWDLPAFAAEGVASAGFAEEYGSATDILLRRAQHGEKAVGLHFLWGNK